VRFFDTREDFAETVQGESIDGMQVGTGRWRLGSRTFLRRPARKGWVVRGV
jgi:hypothetical protein